MVVLALLAACEGPRSLLERERLGLSKRGSQASPPSASASPAVAAQAATTAAVEISVTPPRGISVLMDGARVADTSPFVAQRLTPGRHILEVRAMGYHEVTLPLDLAPGEHLAVPVALRRRHGAQDEPSEAPGNIRAAPPAPGSPTPALPQVAAAPKEHGRAQGRGPEPLPPGARAMVLDIKLAPLGPITADGVLIAGAQVRLANGTGELSLGGAALAYRIYPGHVLELVVPHDGAAWFRDGSQVKSASQLRLEGQPMTLRRVAAEGAWDAVLHRLE